MGGIATDVAGEVVEVGPGVKDFKAGDKVVALLAHFVSIALSYLFFSIAYFASTTALLLSELNL